MGQVLTGLWSIFSFKRPYKLLILGLNNAGKTSILYHLQLGHTIQTQPTLGGNTEKLTITNPSNQNTITFTCWDLGGQEQLRGAWSLYYEQTDAVLFVVDAAEPARFATAKTILHKLLTEEPELRQSILLVLANKQDLDSAASPAELMEVLELGKFKDRTWTLMGCSAATGESLNEAMNWIAESLDNR
ncbi:Arf/Sar family, other [Strigomonas culicis]|uniref:Arf/Sar family, other n=1 Tax=Strigomonas culicis TaxID=28005 RepID=S9VB62_9TRYP|nr:Arf/Sar family, other [Strigomonas culicis]EPY32059.1 Arf/Sar family, other [Strigomonas culicis]EPY35888.1 Arf/Sar family, other [Strigomonas culicis]|eukprot:EPY24266.1 Arf/Sar family, other [Strigomonas culicis]